ncbi:adenosylcobinamide-GDP ribazoletransferase [Sphingomonas sp. HF-S4]|uniref:Adenosylcobinamide-GDP ribazoletransferase n=1 Tax=Sphingomonas agrestis TaxID=3080540 RepID=A0ABU3YC23_9SPHN|nr:adenosylcobinamide-GDP ribazoletransferase [Sphingomonas sp. HF-S4]MDV3458950.1 adenosylcobinamide-GDP ribazoletransferase [Sphingomonas sp. HF-S4]
MKGLVIALLFLTRLPMPRVQVSDAEFAASMRWFPAVGLILGALIAGGTWAGAQLDPWVGALAGVALWVGLTGALHLDGLGDVADACGAAHKHRERVLEVLADPHLGSFGAVAIGLQLLAKLILLHALVEAGGFVALLLLPFAARIGPLVWTCWLPDLHAGLASRFRNMVRPADLAIWAIALVAGAWFAPALLATPLLLLGWGFWLRAKLGGISGDGHGAGIEVTETGLLLATLIVARLA